MIESRIIDFGDWLMVRKTNLGWFPTLRLQDSGISREMMVRGGDRHEGRWWPVHKGREIHEGNVLEKGQRSNREGTRRIW